MQVAAAERQTQQDVPVLVTGSWILRIESSSLTGKLRDLSILSQQPKPGSEDADLLFGTVDSARSVTVYGIVGGSTDLIKSNGQMRQYVSFDLVIDDMIYEFRQGEVADGLNIKGGVIFSNPVVKDREPAVEDGTWSAQATPADDHHHHRHGGRSKHRRD